MRQAILNWLETVLEERYGVPLLLQDEGDSVALRLSDGAGCVRVKSELVTFCRARSELAHGVWLAEAEGWTSPSGQALHAAGALPTQLPLIEKDENGDHVVHYDILGFTYWMLSRQEEVDRSDLDEHGRFPATSSHACRFGYLERPVIDEWLDVLGQVICRQWPRLELKKHRLSIKLSHDVDRPSRYGFRSFQNLFRGMAGDIVRGDVVGAFSAPLIRLGGRRALHSADRYNTFDWIMDASERRGLVSAFYFICGRTDPTKDADYEIEAAPIRSLMRHIHERGHEIGLHPSYNTYLNPQAIKAEADRLAKVCVEERIRQDQWGGRMHYLRWNVSKTLEGWASAGMTYDSTLGYADRPGFRCGTCHEYFGFDPVLGHASKVRIRPLIVMEGSVLSAKYLGIHDASDALIKFLTLRRSCATVGGNFTMLWHNSELHDVNLKAIYEQVIDSSGSRSEDALRNV